MGTEREEEMTLNQRSPQAVQELPTGTEVEEILTPRSGETPSPCTKGLSLHCCSKKIMATAQPQLSEYQQYILGALNRPNHEDEQFLMRCNMSLLPTFQMVDKGPCGLSETPA